MCGWSTLSQQDVGLGCNKASRSAAQKGTWSGFEATLSFENNHIPRSSASVAHKPSWNTHCRFFLLSAFLSQHLIGCLYTHARRGEGAFPVHLYCLGTISHVDMTTYTIDNQQTKCFHLRVCLLVSLCLRTYSVYIFIDHCISLLTLCLLFDMS